jgi:hypothetical protein
MSEEMGILEQTEGYLIHLSTHDVEPTKREQIRARALALYLEAHHKPARPRWNKWWAVERRFLEPGFAVGVGGIYLWWTAQTVIGLLLL